MHTRIMRSTGDGVVSLLSELPETEATDCWVWVDVTVGTGDFDKLLALTAGLKLDALAVRDAAHDLDLPKVDDFGHHLLVVLHGIRDDRVETYEVDCFMTDRYLVTVHESASPTLDAVWARLEDGTDLASGGVDELLARIADVLTRRFLAVVDAVDDAAEVLLHKALSADGDLLSELTAVRSDLSSVRRAVHPQREVLDVLRRTQSPLVTGSGQRRFADTFDVAMRTVSSLDAARSALAEILDAYRGAEARKATDVTMVLTVYAAIMLPLSLVAGFFGMNFTNIPGLGRDWGWVAASALMVAIAVLSLGVFVAQGWIRRPSGRRAGASLARGLVEAARAPVQVVGAVYEVSAMPIRATARRASANTNHEDEPSKE